MTCNLDCLSAEGVCRLPVEFNSDASFSESQLLGPNELLYSAQLPPSFLVQPVLETRIPLRIKDLFPYSVLSGILWD